jgi:DNA helicase-2/ATP-dependent DNA helicase PcrA
MNLDSLNKEQREVVETTEGPMMVLAGAGSGKTRALTHKVSYLIEEKGIAPWEILAITFTNKAANEMKERIVDLTNLDGSHFNIFTFHSFCSRFLRQEIEHLGRTRTFSIYDDSESIAVIKSIIKAKKLNPEEFIPSNIHHYIKRLKDYCHYIGQKEEDVDIELDIKHDFYEVYKDYEKELQKSNAVDFGGLITSVVDILESNPSVLEKYQDKYKYILVDEFQDTNKSQLVLTKMLALKNKNITVIGDDFQSIYRFRNADIKNFLDFDKVFPEVKFIKLEENYRSTKTIVKAANAIISNNKFQKEKILFSNKEEGQKIKLISCYNQQAEAEIVGNAVYRLANTPNIKPNEVCILFRNNAQSRTIEEKLRSMNVPYILTGGMKFYERKEIKDAICLLRLVLNHNDSCSILRMINNPARGIGKKTLESLSEYCLNNNLSLFDALKKIPKEIKVSKKAQEGISKFVDAVVEATKEYNDSKKITKTYQILMKKTEYVSTLEKSTKHEDQARVDNLKEFFGSLIEADSKERDMVDFLESISLTINLDEGDIDRADCINLMTVHSSKGLEFEYVYILGLEENLFPSKRSLEEFDDMYGLEEERRLFYVAVTRCKKHLAITACKTRFLYGQKLINRASRFLKEIPEDLYEVIYN